MNKLLEKLHKYDIKMKIKNVKNEENKLEIIFKKGKHSYCYHYCIGSPSRDGNHERVALSHLNQFINTLEWREKREVHS